MTLTVDHYPNSLHELDEQLAQARRGHPGTRINVLAQTLIDGAIRLDMERARNLGLVASYKEHGVVRDADHPPEFEHPDARSGAGTDNPAHPLPNGEHWNQGRRATLTGAEYGADDKGRPVNPYMNTGLTGRGMMWLYGPNHCIDNGVLEIATDEHGQPVLNIIGIRRKDDAQKRPALSGGFAKFRKAADGSFFFDQEAILDTRLEEFFEEMVSDSVPLLPAYAARVEAEFADAVQAAGSRSGGALSPERIHELRDQAVVALKLEQVRTLDPEFLARLKDFLAQGLECFAGPVLASGRATNNAWIESRMSWVMLDEAAWKNIAGNGPFDYKLSGGDDSDGVFHFSVTPETIKSALPSHGPMMTFMLASFLLDAQERGVDLHPNIMRQLENIADFYSPPSAALPPSNPAPQ
jgi:hypothetical protein